MFRQTIIALRDFFSLKYVSAAVVIISMAGKVIQKFFFIGLDDDKCFQIQATKNLLYGKGVSIHEVFADNLSSPTFSTLIKWPPGLSFILSPFYSLFGNNFLWGTLWLDLITAALFVWFARKIILQFPIPLWLVNVYTLVTGFFLYDFIYYNSSDLLTLVFLQAAILFTLKFIASPDKKYLQAFIIVVLLFMCGCLRYMYIPVVFVIPAYILLIGRINKNAQLFKRGIFMLLSVSFLILSMLAFQKINGGAATYLHPLEKGFFPGNLFATTPFLFSSVATLEPPAIFLQEVTHIKFNTISNSIIGIHLIVLLFAILFSLRWVYRKRGAELSLYQHLIFITIFCSIVILFLLSYLSVQNAPLRLINGLNWTYVNEVRYFAAPIFLIQLILVVAFLRWYSSGKIRYIILLAAAIPFFASALHGFYFTAKKLTTADKNFFHKKEIVMLDSCKKLFHQFVQKNKDKMIVSASGDPMFNNFASLWENIPGLYDIQKLNTMDFHTEREIILFVPVKSWYSEQLAGFLKNPDKCYIGQVNDWTFYSINVSPTIK